VATPAVMREPHDALFAKAVQGGTEEAGAYWTYQSVFLTNNGLVTSFRSDGRSAFQTPTQSIWGDQNFKAAEAEKKRKARRRTPRKINKPPKAVDPFLELKRMAMFPSVTPFSLRADPDAREDHIAVIGEETFTVLSQEGYIRGEVNLPNLPIGPPIVGDFNNDGINDFVIVTPEGFCGVVAVEGVGKYLFMALTTLLLIVLLMALASKMQFFSSFFSSDDTNYESTEKDENHGLRVRTFGVSTHDPTRIPRRHIIANM